MQTLGTAISTCRSRLSLALRRILPSKFVAAVSPHCFITHITQGQVISGPFSGVKLEESASGSACPPRLLGCYEKELHAIIESIVVASPSTIVDVGAAEGYYICGFGSRLPDARLFAYEMADSARRILARNIDANQLLDRAEVRGECRPEDLIEDLKSAPDACLFVDAEGAEHKLLTTGLSLHLKQATVLVELHPWCHPDLEKDVVRALSPNHDLEFIHTRERGLCDLPTKVSPFIRLFRRRLLLYLISEHRSCPMKWIYATPKA